MKNFKIDLAQIEEWQITNNLNDLELIFSKAKRAIVQGQNVLIERKNEDGSIYIANEFSTEPDLLDYRETVLKYLKSDH